jgi:hypothetical protein
MPEKCALMGREFDVGHGSSFYDEKWSFVLDRGTKVDWECMRIV